MNSNNAVPLLSPVTCVDYGFVYFGSWSTPKSEPYSLYKDARYLVIQHEPTESLNVSQQIVIPRAALSWLMHLVRYPFAQPDGYEGCFDGETLKLRRGTTLNGEGVAGFYIQNVSRITHAKMQSAQHIMVSDDFMREYLVPLMDGLNSGS